MEQPVALHSFVVVRPHESRVAALCLVTAIRHIKGLDELPLDPSSRRAVKRAAWLAEKEIRDAANAVGIDLGANPDTPPAAADEP